MGKKEVGVLTVREIEEHNTLNADKAAIDRAFEVAFNTYVNMLADWEKDNRDFGGRLRDRLGVENEELVMEYENRQHKVFLVEEDE